MQCANRSSFLPPSTFGAGVLLVLPLLLLTIFVSTPSWAIGLNPSPNNPPCPQIGYADGCDEIITISPLEMASIVTTSQPAYDGSEDQLVGVVNDGLATVLALNLSSPVGSDIFGFDGDGASQNAPGCIPGEATAAPICGTGGTYGYGGTGVGLLPDPTDYEGPDTFFSNISAGLNDGTINFVNGLAPGQTAWFSLEGAPQNPSVLTGGVTPVTTVPEPSSLLLLGSGLAGLGAWKRKREKTRRRISAQRLDGAFAVRAAGMYR
jgi:hypothetical protein